MLSMMAFPMIKKVTIVGEDIDSGSLRDVEWAVVTRCEADRDIVIIPDLQGQPETPGFQGQGSAKIGIDATMPGKTTEGRARVATGNPGSIGRLLQSIGGVDERHCRRYWGPRGSFMVSALCRHSRRVGWKSTRGYPVGREEFHA